MVDLFEFDKVYMRTVLNYIKLKTRMTTGELRIGETYTDLWIFNTTLKLTAMGRKAWNSVVKKGVRVPGSMFQVPKTEYRLQKLN